MKIHSMNKAVTNSYQIKERVVQRLVTGPIMCGETFSTGVIHRLLVLQHPQEMCTYQQRRVSLVHIHGTNIVYSTGRTNSVIVTNL